MNEPADFRYLIAVDADAALERVLEDIGHERAAQDARWGEQNHPDGTGIRPIYDMDAADQARNACEEAFEHGFGTWRHILTEEYREALAESDPVALRTELIQSAAVIVAWVQHIDRRAGGEGPRCSEDES